MTSTRADMRYRSVGIDGLDIFYREAGPRDAPVILLLHGFPSSSRMYETLMPLLARDYRLLAPDYPGFGHSSAPQPDAFEYTFDHLADVTLHFIDALNLPRYTLVMQDYGGPVGFRVALSRPERVEALVVQNAVAHEAGLGPLWETRKAFWKDRATHEAALRANLLSFEATRLRHVGRSPNQDRYDPDTWTDEFAFLSRPGQIDIQTELFYDYRTNVASYPLWQQFPADALRRRAHRCGTRLRPRLRRTGRSLPTGGHFVLDEAADQVAKLMKQFLATRLAR